MNDRVSEVAMASRKRAFQNFRRFDFYFDGVEQPPSDLADLLCRKPIDLAQHPREFRNNDEADKSLLVWIQLLFHQPLGGRRLPWIVRDKISNKHIRIERDHEMERLKASATARPIASFISSMLTGGPSYLMQP